MYFWALRWRIQTNGEADSRFIGISVNKNHSQWRSALLKSASEMVNNRLKVQHRNVYKIQRTEMVNFEPFKLLVLLLAILQTSYGKIQ